MAEKTDKKIEDEQKTKKFRMTLSSKAVEPLEKVTKELVKKANGINSFTSRGRQRHRQRPSETPHQAPQDDHQKESLRRGIQDLGQIRNESIDII